MFAVFGLLATIVVIATSVPSSPRECRYDVLCMRLRLLSPSFPLQRQSFVFRMDVPRLRPVLLVRFTRGFYQGAYRGAIVQGVSNCSYPYYRGAILSSNRSTASHHAQAGPTSTSSVSKLYVLRIVGAVQVLLQRPLVKGGQVAQNYGHRIYTCPRAVLRHGQHAIRGYAFVISGATFSGVSVSAVFAMG